MATPETFEAFIERAAQANIQALVKEGALDPNDKTRMDRALEMARSIKRGSEEEKQNRVFSVSNPTAEHPFVGCSAICSLTGRAVGGIEGPNDFCKTKEDKGGTLFFCSHPNVPALPSGSLPLCFDYQQDHWNNNGVKLVGAGKIVLKK